MSVWFHNFREKNKPVILRLKMKSYNISLDCIDKQAQNNPDDLAMLFVQEEHGQFNSQKLSFDFFRRKTNQFAQWICDSKISTGSRVLIALKNSPECAIAFLGSIKAGMIPIPLSPLLTKNELDFFLQDSGACVLITDVSNFISMSSLHLQKILFRGESSQIPQGQELVTLWSEIETCACEFQTQTTQALHQLPPTHSPKANDSTPFLSLKEKPETLLR